MSDPLLPSPSNQPFSDHKAGLPTSTTNATGFNMNNSHDFMKAPFLNIDNLTHGRYFVKHIGRMDVSFIYSSLGFKLGFTDSRSQLCSSLSGVRIASEIGRDRSTLSSKLLLIYRPEPNDDARKYYLLLISRHQREITGVVTSQTILGNGGDEDLGQTIPSSLSRVTNKMFVAKKKQQLRPNNQPRLTRLRSSCIFVALPSPPPLPTSPKNSIFSLTPKTTLIHN